jgi:predicted DNA-binding transcriptional regulator YafY
VYWGAVVLVITALRQQRTEGFTVRKISEQFGVTRSTLRRWLAYFRDLFPPSATWQRLRSRWLPAEPPEAIPAALLIGMERARDGPQATVAKCLEVLLVGAI